MTSLNKRTYTDREIDEFQRDVRESLTRIEVQTRLTNGRVSSVENWRSFMIGGMSVLTLVVIPILGWALWVLNHIDDRIQTSVEHSLTAYVKEVK